MLTDSSQKSKTVEQRKARRNARKRQSGRFDYLDPSWVSSAPLKGDRARLMSHYSLGTSQPDILPMTVEPELNRRWEDKCVPVKTPDIAIRRKEALNRDWLATDHLPPDAKVETFIDDPVTGTRLATISNFVNASEIARLIELVDLAPTFPARRLTVDQRHLRAYRYTHVGANEDEVVGTVEDRMAAVSGLPINPQESRLMLTEYLALPRSHPAFPVNNIHIDVDLKPTRTATFLICAQLTSLQQQILLRLHVCHLLL